MKRKKRGLQREPWHLIDHGQETPKDSSKMLFTQYVWHSFQNCLNNWLRLKVNSSSHMFVFRPGFILTEFFLNHVIPWFLALFDSSLDEFLHRVYTVQFFHSTKSPLERNRCPYTQWSKYESNDTLVSQIVSTHCVF